MNATPHLSQSQISHSSVPPSQQYQSHMDHQTSSILQNAYHSPQVSTQLMTKFPQLDSGLAVLVFIRGEDWELQSWPSILTCASLNPSQPLIVSTQSFLNDCLGSPTCQSLKTHPLHHSWLLEGGLSGINLGATIQEGRVTVQQVQGRQGQSYAGIGYKGNATSFEGNNAGGPRNAAWFKDKAMLTEAHESGQILDKEKLAFLADPSIPDGQVAQTTIPNDAAFQTEDLDAYDSDCDDVSTTQAVLMANLSNYGSDVISERLNIDLSTREKITGSQIDDTIKEKLALKQQIDSPEQNLSNQIKEKESLLQTFTKIKELDNIVYKVGQSAQTMHMLTKPQVFYDDTHKQALGYQNPFYLKKAQRIKPTLYDGSVISSQHAVIPVINDEEPLILEELNRLSKDFGKHFVPQQELSAEQAFWLQTLHPNTDQSDISPIKYKAPRELPKVSLVNTGLKKLKYHLGKFDTMVIKRITLDTITEGEWGFEHTKAVFLNEIIPFLKTLKDIFNVFDKDLLNECSDLDAELLKKQNVYNELLKSYSQLEKHCISLELTMQLNQEIFQKDKSCNNQNALEISKYFKNNDLKAQLQAKDITIRKLKEHIKSKRENDKEEKVKQDIVEIETINIELEHSVAKLLSKNELLHEEIEHLKKIYKDQFDSIKKTRALLKEHYDSLIAQLNSKSMENADLKGSEDGLIRRIQGVGYGVLGVSWSRDHAQIRHIFLMDTAYWSSE
ncbi:hypothetical protein Tco_0004992 [Tanacetum coccineum]